MAVCFTSLPCKKKKKKDDVREQSSCLCCRTHKLNGHKIMIISPLIWHSDKHSFLLCPFLCFLTPVYSLKRMNRLMCATHWTKAHNLLWGSSHTSFTRDSLTAENHFENVVHPPLHWTVLLSSRSPMIDLNRCHLFSHALSDTAGCSPIQTNDCNKCKQYVLRASATGRAVHPPLLLIIGTFCTKRLCFWLPLENFYA